MILSPHTYHSLLVDQDIQIHSTFHLREIFYKTAHWSSGVRKRIWKDNIYHLEWMLVIGKQIYLLYSDFI